MIIYAYLVGCDEVWAVDGGSGCDRLEVRSDLFLQRIVQDTSTLHSISEVHRGDIPTVNFDIIRVHHWDDVIEWYVDLFTLCIHSQANCTSLKIGDGSILMKDWPK